jgi:fatty-acyl-CoA synthase
VPVQVVAIPVMPLTGVGKIFKPALRLEATQRAFEAALQPLKVGGVDTTVLVRNDPEFGTVGEVQLTGVAAESREATTRRCAELLGGFQVRHVVEFR